MYKYKVFRSAPGRQQCLGWRGGRRGEWWWRDTATYINVCAHTLMIYLKNFETKFLKLVSVFLYVLNFVFHFLFEIKHFIILTSPHGLSHKLIFKCRTTAGRLLLHGGSLLSSVFYEQNHLSRNSAASFVLKQVWNKYIIRVTTRRSFFRLYWQNRCSSAVLLAPTAVRRTESDGFCGNVVFCTDDVWWCVRFMFVQLLCGRTEINIFCSSMYYSGMLRYKKVYLNQKKIVKRASCWSKFIIKNAGSSLICPVEQR